MIKINLLEGYNNSDKVADTKTTITESPVKQQIVGLKEGKRDILIGLSVVFVVVVSCFVMDYIYEGRIERIEDKIAVVKKRMKDLSRVESRLKDFENKNAQVQKRIKLLNDLEKSKTNAISLMGLISYVIPDRLWIKEVRYAGQGIKFDGVSENEHQVADFIDGMQKSGYFKNVNLKLIETGRNNTKHNGSSLRDFSINSEIDFTDSKPLPDS